MRLISTANLAETHTSQMVRRVPRDLIEEDELLGLGPAIYGLGWFVRDYRGHRLVYHAGNIDGFSALVTLLPRDQLGIVGLANGNVTPLPTAVTYRLVDRALGLPKTDWNAALEKQEKRREEQAAAALKARAEHRRPGTKPARELAAYTRAHEDPGYGTASVSLENGALALRWASWTAPLEHYHYDTFTLKGDSPLAREDPETGDDQVVFSLGADGEVATMRLLGRDFKRAPRPR